MKVKVFYHDKCFDGTCSAALFSRFYRERIRSAVDFEFLGLLHRAGSLFDETQFTGDEIGVSIGENGTPMIRLGDLFPDFPIALFISAR